MDITLTLPDGKEIILKDISVGGLFKWEYHTTMTHGDVPAGTKKIYYLRITEKEKTVCG